MNADRRSQAAVAFERATAAPMLFVSLAIIPLLIAPLAFDLGNEAELIVFTADWIIWALFAAEFSVKTYLSADRPRYVLTHWFDLILVLVPFLRPLRVARSARALRTFRAARAGAAFVRLFSTVRSILRMNGLQYALLAGACLIVACAGLMWFVERDEGNIDDLATALWWAMTTVTTVGYGDAYPTTPAGRGIAVFLMIVGITLFGMLTATLASFFVRNPDAASIDDVLAELTELRDEVRALASRVGPPPAS